MKKLLIFLVAAGCWSNVPAFGALQTQSRAEDDPNAIFGVTATTAKPSDMIFFMPAQLGGVLGTVVGNVAGWPVKIVYKTCSGDFSMDSFVPPNSFAVRYVGTPMAYVVGSPFWCLKKAFWDGPVWLFSDSSNEPDIQYKE